MKRHVRNSAAPRRRHPRPFRIWPRLADRGHPILNNMGIQTCPLPTAVLSTQTGGMTGFTFHDLTGEMHPILDHWQRLQLTFDCVYSGFLGNLDQVEIAERCVRDFLKPSGFALVDPVLADNGVLLPTQTMDMVRAMRRLISCAHIVTPNLTEAALLLDEPYDPGLSPEALKRQLVRLSDMGPRQVVITSAPAYRDGYCASVAYDRTEGRFWMVSRPLDRRLLSRYGRRLRQRPCRGPAPGRQPAPCRWSAPWRFVTRGISVTLTQNTVNTEGILLEQVLSHSGGIGKASASLRNSRSSTGLSPFIGGYEKTCRRKVYPFPGIFFSASFVSRHYRTDEAAQPPGPNQAENRVFFPRNGRAQALEGNAFHTENAPSYPTSPNSVCFWGGVASPSLFSPQTDSK